MGYYCHRCQREFRTVAAIDQHERDSKSHNPCMQSYCDFDGETWDELMQHCREEEHGVVCKGCNPQKIWWSECQEYWEHVDDNNVCEACERHFGTSNELNYHQMTHLHRELPCYACGQEFKTYTHMILHIGGGWCSVATSGELDRAAAECPQWSQYIYGRFRQALLDEEDHEDYYAYHCPECRISFRYLSGLLQHTDSDRCPRSLAKGPMSKLVKWLDDEFE